MFLALTAGVLAGAALPIQTSINTRLARAVGSTMLASLTSFAVGTVLLAAILAATGLPGVPLTSLGGQPWWLWIGGACGVAFLTLNMVLMRAIGASMTVILPVVGQVIGGLAIDAGGLFGAATRPLTGFRIVGALLVIAGALTVNGRPVTPPRDPASPAPPGGTRRAALMAAGIAGGVLGAIQTTVNGRLGVVLGSPVAAAFVSFAVGTALLFLIVAVTTPRSLTPRSAAIARSRPPGWLFTGGLIGAMFVLTNAFGAPVLGTALMVGVVLLGQVISGLAVDHRGFLGSMVRPLTRRKVVGAALVLAGVACVRLLG